MKKSEDHKSVVGRWDSLRKISSAEANTTWIKAELPVDRQSTGDSLHQVTIPPDGQSSKSTCYYLNWGCL